MLVIFHLNEFSKCRSLKKPLKRFNLQTHLYHNPRLKPWAKLKPWAMNETKLIKCIYPFPSPMISQMVLYKPIFDIAHGFNRGLNK